MQLTINLPETFTEGDVSDALGQISILVSKGYSEGHLNNNHHWSFTEGSPCVHTASCRHCDRDIYFVDGAWIDPEADGDDIMWRETCDQHDTVYADHEPA